MKKKIKCKCKKISFYNQPSISVEWPGSADHFSDGNFERQLFSPLVVLVCLCFKCVVTQFALVEEEGGLSETSRIHGRVLCATLGACMCD